MKWKKETLVLDMLLRITDLNLSQQHELGERPSAPLIVNLTYDGKTYSDVLITWSWNH